jgi:hypothetical protein
MAPRQIRAPKLSLTSRENVALRRAHLARIDLVRLDPLELVKATDGEVSTTRAKELCALAQFQQLPNVGPSVATDLSRLGLRDLADVRKADPDSLLRRLEKIAGKQDPCVGDVLHSAVWNARNPRGPERPWWEWSRERLEQKSKRARH